MAFIDESVIARLVVEQLETVTGLVAFYVGEPEEPDALGASDAAFRLLAVGLEPRPRKATDEPDIADVVVTIAVYVHASHASIYSITNATALVRQALDQQTLRDAATTHRLDLCRAAASPEVEIDEQRGLRAAAITVAGVAHRNTGTTLESHL